MKILCLCHRGNSRSVALAWILKEERGHEAIASGVDVIGEDTRKMLYDWAEKIILVDKRYEHWIPTEYRKKLWIWDVGRDSYFNGFDKKLIKKFNRYIDEYKLENEYPFNF